MLMRGLHSYFPAPPIRLPMGALMEIGLLSPY